ncbi:MAG TPA: RDD family protein [Acidimicrobiia bacterium]|jgi:curved DNA-binding protein CbpA|nr:RDD family protein [Acidimicrobiia bacterium]
MDDYYELLDVAPDADREEIRGAYRTKRDDLQAQDGDDTRGKVAELNRAWNVLSDPTQRQRYDDRLARARESGDDGDGEHHDDRDGEDGGERPVPVTRAQRREEIRHARQNRMTATVTLPNGLVVAPVRRRLVALATDVVILLALFSAVQLIGARQVDKRFPGERSHASALQKRVDAVDKTIDADKKKVSAAKDKHDTAAEKTATDEQNADQKKKDGYNKEIDDINRDFAPGLKVVYAIGVLVAFLYLVPLTALTGQTVGKRLQKIRVVRVADGSPVGWKPTLIRFGLPLGVAMLLGVLILGEFALLLGIIFIIGWVNRPDRQGIHDRLAKTVVVEA